MNTQPPIALQDSSGAASAVLPRDADIVFYDGRCGLCHATVRFILARDGSNRAADDSGSGDSPRPSVPDNSEGAPASRVVGPAPRFLFSPLQGRTICDLIPSDRRAALPDSVVVLTPDGRLLLRSAAVVRILYRLGGPWRPVAGLLRVVPRPVADAGYRLFARIRRALFRQPDGMCPMIPERLRDRFLP